MESMLNSSQVITMVTITWLLLTLLIGVGIGLSYIKAKLLILETRKDRRDIRRLDLLDYFSKDLDQARHEIKGIHEKLAKYDSWECGCTKCE